MFLPLTNSVLSRHYAPFHPQFIPFHKENPFATAKGRRFATSFYIKLKKTDLEWSVLLCKVVSRNPLPVARRYSGDCWLGSSPGSGSSQLQTFPEPFFQWHLLKQLSHYSGGTAPALHRTSLLSPCGHLNPLYAVFFIKLNTSSFVLFVKSFFDILRAAYVYNPFI